MSKSTLCSSLQRELGALSTGTCSVGVGGPGPPEKRPYVQHLSGGARRLLAGCGGRRLIGVIAPRVGRQVVGINFPEQPRVPPQRARKGKK